MRLLAVDPSSTCTGWAVLDGARPRDYVDAGRIRLSGELTDRILSLRKGLHDVIQRHKPRHVVIEIPNVKQHGRIPGRAQGQAIYGCAVGVAAGLCFARLGAAHVSLVSASEWTGRTSKAHRVDVMSRIYRAYHWGKRPQAHNDVADALALGGWWFARQRMMES